MSYRYDRRAAKISPKDPNFHTVAIGLMQQAWKQEGLEAATLKDAIEMYAWDLGYNSLRDPRYKLPDWLAPLGKLEGVDVMAAFRKGQKAYSEE